MQGLLFFSEILHMCSLYQYLKNFSVVCFVLII